MSGFCHKKDAMLFIFCGLSKDESCCTNQASCKNQINSINSKLISAELNYILHSLTSVFSLYVLTCIFSSGVPNQSQNLHSIIKWSFFTCLLLTAIFLSKQDFQLNFSPQKSMWLATKLNVQFSPHSLNFLNTAGDAGQRYHCIIMYMYLIRVTSEMTFSRTRS